MSWRINDLGFPQYSAICTLCGKPRGWPTKQRAQATADHLGVEPSRLTIEEYVDGEDDTCPHDASLDRPLPARRPRKPRQPRR